MDEEEGSRWTFWDVHTINKRLSEFFPTVAEDKWRLTDWRTSRWEERSEVSLALASKEATKKAEQGRSYSSQKKDEEEEKVEYDDEDEEDDRQQALEDLAALEGKTEFLGSGLGMRLAVAKTASHSWRRHMRALQESVDIYAVMMEDKEETEEWWRQQTSSGKGPEPSERLRLLDLPPPPPPLPPCLQCVEAGIRCSLAAKPYARAFGRVGGWSEGQGEERESERSEENEKFCWQPPPWMLEYDRMTNNLKLGRDGNQIAERMVQIQALFVQQQLRRAVDAQETDSPFLPLPPLRCIHCVRKGIRGCLQQTLDLTRVVTVPASKGDRMQSERQRWRQQRRRRLRLSSSSLQPPPPPLAWFASSGPPPEALLPQHCCPLLEQIKRGQGQGYYDTSMKDKEKGEADAKNDERGSEKFPRRGSPFQPSSRPSSSSWSTSSSLPSPSSVSSRPSPLSPSSPSLFPSFEPANSPPVELEAIFCRDVKAMTAVEVAAEARKCLARIGVKRQSGVLFCQHQKRSVWPASRPELYRWVVWAYDKAGVNIEDGVAAETVNECAKDVLSRYRIALAEDVNDCGDSDATADNDDACHAGKAGLLPPPLPLPRWNIHPDDGFLKGPPSRHRWQEYFLDVGEDRMRQRVERWQREQRELLARQQLEERQLSDEGSCGDSYHDIYSRSDDEIADNSTGYLPDENDDELWLYTDSDSEAETTY